MAIFSGVLNNTLIKNARGAGAKNYNSVDSTPPVISAKLLDAVSGIYPATCLVATFSEEVVMKTGGTITLGNLGDSSGNSDFLITRPNAQAILSDRDLIIDPASSSAPG